MPGGPAKRKSLALTPGGLDAVRDYVAHGGRYLGFCGGAGLALSGGHGLGICPWKRKGFSSKLQHLLSGHVHVELCPEHPLVPEELGTSALLPVWWPSRFEEDERSDVRVLARYKTPGPDFCVADLNLKKFPREMLDDWEHLYGVKVWPDFLRDSPAVIQGEFGRGSYFLSYPHPETPASGPGNTWLAHILRDMGFDCQGGLLPAWDVAGLESRWDDPVLMKARLGIESVVDMGIEHMLLFWRTPWLLGWRRGIPGASVNTLYSLICQIMACPPSEQGGKYWELVSDHFANMLDLFVRGANAYLLAERMAMTVYHTSPDSIFPKALKEQKTSLFGPPPGVGGLFAELYGMLENLAAYVFSDCSGRE